MEDNNVEINGRAIFSTSCYFGVDAPQDGFSEQHHQERRREAKVDRPRRIYLDPQVCHFPGLLPTLHVHVLFRRVDSLDVRHDSEIDWKTFPDSDWNLWSPHLLQRRWMTMKRSINGHENMTHAGALCFTLPRIG